MPCRSSDVKWKTNQNRRQIQTIKTHAASCMKILWTLCAPVTLCDCLFDLHSTTIVSGESLLWSGSSNGSIYRTLNVTCAVHHFHPFPFRVNHFQDGLACAYSNNPGCKRDESQRQMWNIFPMHGPYYERIQGNCCCNSWKANSPARSKKNNNSADITPTKCIDLFKNCIVVISCRDMSPLLGCPTTSAVFEANRHC